MSWIQTYTGKRFDVLHPRIEDICIEDIAHALSNICRFTGHTRHFYSVAQHSCYAALMVDPALALRALLHDASEAYLCDLARPVKRIQSLESYREIEAVVQRAVYTRFGLDSNEPEVIKTIDNRLLATEAAQLLGPLRDEWTAHLGQPFAIAISEWTPPEAKHEFLSHFHLATKGTVLDQLR